MLLSVENLRKTFSGTPVLHGIDLKVEKGDVVAIIGPSGSGKTTLFRCLNFLEKADGGRLTFAGETFDLAKISRNNILRIRKRTGFVFQNYNLFRNLTALENVELASQICRDPLDAATAVREVGLEDRMDNFPSQLSGGEQQRISIARALAKNPKLLLCDEPTGALDYVTGKSILKLLQDTCRRDGMTVVIITHNAALAAMADRIIRVKSGHIYSVRMNEHITPVEQLEW